MDSRSFPPPTVPSPRRGSAKSGSDRITWAHHTAQALVSAVAILSRQPELARPPIAPWLIAQAEPQWRGTLRLAIELVQRERPCPDSTNRDSTNGANKNGDSTNGKDSGGRHSAEESKPDKDSRGTSHATHHSSPWERLPESLLKSLSGLARPPVDGPDENNGPAHETSWFITHFYEQFLAEVDPSGRQQRGVYYTPRVVVQRMVSDVEALLESEFGLLEGFADPTSWEDLGFPETPHAQLPFLHLLDPAAGSGAFLVEVITRIAERCSPDLSCVTTFDRFLAERLKRIRGYELLIPACLVAQLNVAAQLRSVGFRFTESFPALVQPHDTLAGPQPTERESPDAFGPLFPGKPIAPFTIVLGNPPFSGISANDSVWMQRLLRGQAAGVGGEASYFHVDGQPLNEKKVWLNDDYVQFFRYAQWQVERAGVGMVAFVSNHGYLDNITFRGMRQSLLEAFPRVTIIDLHGNRKRHEMTLDGQPDFNLFGIAQGTAIGYFRKPPALHGQSPRPHFRRWDVVGTEVEKLRQLRHPEWDLSVDGGTSVGSAPIRKPSHEPTCGTTRPQPASSSSSSSPLSTAGATAGSTAMPSREPALESFSEPCLQAPALRESDPRPVGPLYPFTPRGESEHPSLPSGIPLNELMPLGNSVPVTARDHLVVAYSAEELESKLALFADPRVADTSIRIRLFPRARSRRYPAGDTRGWKLGEARRRLRNLADPRSLFRSCLYRPWDRRVIFWASWMIDWPRTELMDVWCAPGNWGLITRRQMLPNQPCNFIWASDQVVLDGILRSDNRGNEYLFPIYRIVQGIGDESGETTSGRVANFSNTTVLQLSRQWSLTWQPWGVGDLETTWGPEDLGHYLYALLHAETYQVAYAGSLRSGFPPIVFPRNRSLFESMSRCGKRLLDCHLRVGRSAPSDGRAASDDGKIWRVQPRFPCYEQGAIWTGPGEEIARVSEAVWEFRAGTHQVAKKWLADRRGRPLTDGDRADYERILAEIEETLDYQSQLRDYLTDAEQIAEEFF
jgi:hypothetical protein